LQLNRAGGSINKQGFKICLELYAKCDIRSHGEVPFSFGIREEGKSKLTGIPSNLSYLGSHFFRKGNFVLHPTITAIICGKSKNFNITNTCDIVSSLYNCTIMAVINQINSYNTIYLSKEVQVFTTSNSQSKW
jgi:hypothetical protein